MEADEQPLTGRAEARLRAFELIQDLQSGRGGAASELAGLATAAADAGWPEVARLGLYGKAVDSWLKQSPTLCADVDALVATAGEGGDQCLVALGLAMRAAFVADGSGPASPAFDQDLAAAVVMLEHTEAGALEMISAHTACGIALDYRSLWELADEQYASALRLAAHAEPGIGDTLLAAVMFNRAEAHVSWASRLRQLGHDDALAERWRSWADVVARSVTFTMPDRWYSELMTLGQVMAALAGVDVSADVRRALAELPATGRRDPRAVGHLKLAAALSAVRGGSDESPRQAVAEALDAVSPDAFPELHDLALYLAAEVEAAEGRPYGLLCARRQIGHRWDDREAQLSAMRSRISTERLRRELDRVTLQVTRDDLTGIGNRRALAAFTEGLDRRGVDRIAFIMVDVDRFKEVNDRHGHDAGDDVLQRIGRVLDHGVRPVDLAVRLGGDEFLVALTGVDGDVAMERAARIMERIDAQPWHEASCGLDVTVSIGVAAGDRGDIDAIRARADRAVYESKRLGGHRVTRGGDH